MAPLAEVAGIGSKASADAAADASSDQTFPRGHRLLRRSDFVRVQASGRRVHTAHFIVLLASGRTEVCRLGVTVGRRVGNSVRRNRIKRLIREVFRRNRGLFPAPCDVVLVARSGSDSLDYGSVLGELTRARSAIERAYKQMCAALEPAEP